MRSLGDREHEIIADLESWPSGRTLKGPTSSELSRDLQRIDAVISRPRTWSGYWQQHLDAWRGTAGYAARRKLPACRSTAGLGGLTGNCLQSNQSTILFCAERASQTNQAKHVLLGARGPLQPRRCIIGKRREDIQMRAG